MEFSFDLPVAERRVSGVYRLIFDNGAFYIGCSVHLGKRYNAWSSSFRTKRGINAEMLHIVSVCFIVKMEVIELCPLSDLKNREAFYLKKYSDNQMLLSRSEYAWVAVIQYDKTGKFIKRHASIGDAARYNSTKLSKVQNVLNGSRTAHKGMVFVYENKKDHKILKLPSRIKWRLPKKTKHIKIHQIDAYGTVIAVHNTYSEASQKVGCTAKNIERVILGEQKTAAGFYWKLYQTQ